MFGYSPWLEMVVSGTSAFVSLGVFMSIMKWPSPYGVVAVAIRLVGYCFLIGLNVVAGISLVLWIGSMTTPSTTGVRSLALPALGCFIAAMLLWIEVSQAVSSRSQADPTSFEDLE